jgi:sugar O-acyltransferase (sialic acid O-acetyltransferase NeuD family)
VLVLYGTGADSIFQVLDTLQRLKVQFRCVSNVRNKNDSILNSSFYIGDLDKFVDTKLLIPIATPKYHLEAYSTLPIKLHGAFQIIRDPSSSISSKAEIGLDTYVAPNTCIDAFSELGGHNYVNRNASIGHHCEIGKFSHIGPGVTIAGRVRIGVQTLVGAGAVILPGVTVGNGVTVGAGCVVTKDVPDFMTVVGNPAREIELN